MTGEHETETNLENEPARYPLAAVSSEAAYDRLTSYGFARRYVAGKTVAVIGREEIGYGSRLFAETAGSVEGLTGSPEAVDLASTFYSAPNVSYQRVSLPDLPFPDDHLDVVVTFGVVENLEHPEGLVREAKRVLKQDGVLVISTLDRQTLIDGRRRGLYVPEFQAMLERHFDHVRLYRQGAVTGGFVFPASGEVTGALVETARPSLAYPHLGAEPPVTRSVIAVCCGAEVLRQQPYLLLDRDRRMFDECEDLAEDVELLRDEIQHMQETEIQAFRDTIRVHASMAADLNRALFYLSAMKNYMVRRLLGPYRRMRDKTRGLD